MRLVLSLFFAFWVGEAQAATFNYDERTGRLLIWGGLDKADVSQFARIASSKPISYVELVGPGGSAYHAIALGKAIRAQGLSTYVGKGKSCLSGCAIVWLSGVQRGAHRQSRIGFHAASCKQRDKISAQANAMLGSYITSLGFDTDVVLFAVGASPFEFNYLGDEWSNLTSLTYSWIDRDDMPALASR